SRFESSNSTLSWQIAPPEGLYDFYVGYRSPFGEKGYGLDVGDQSASGFLDQSNAFAQDFVGQFFLDGATTQVDVQPGWGWYEIDYLEVRRSQPREALPVQPTLNHPNPTARTRFLMEYLTEHYGEQTLFAQQREFGRTSGDQIYPPSYLQLTGGIQPALLGSDLINYSHSRWTRYDERRNETERVINWAQQTGGIPSMMWHWNAPSGLIDQPGQEWWRGFYTNATTFDIAQAMANPNSNDYALLMRDIDEIAVELKKFQAADIPVLWRPLHEAQGGWFWWGAEGAEPLKQLWRVLHDRLTNQHGLDNLIWVYTYIGDDASDTDWYPGDDVVDIVGIDIYGSSGDSMAGQWSALLDQFDGDKLLALTETGALPPDEVHEQFGVDWRWTMPWSEQFLRDNHTPAEVQQILADENLIDLSELPQMPWQIVPGAVPGDFDGDGDADADDYAVWRFHYELQSSTPADANGDGVVDAADYTAWRDATAAASANGAVAPEPSALASLGVALLAALRGRPLRSAP
ncbi:MAG: glycosyl hydrolase, partial [Planctomycetota bacterium]